MKNEDKMKFSKERVIEIVKSTLNSPLSPMDAYGISLEARIKDAIKTIKKLN